MSPEIRDAFDEVLAHWGRLAVSAPGEALGARSCAFCRMFNHREIALEDQCDGCPIAASTGLICCGGTPYPYAVLAIAEHGYNSPEFREAAAAEHAFLRSVFAAELRKGGDA